METLTQQAAYQTEAASRISDIALRATLHEASASGKPGLVCPDSAGAHQDMDFVSMVSGALSLKPYFTDAAGLGFHTASHNALSVFPLLRELGTRAEAAMYKATGGVNTHKGLIFSLGLFCAAAGRATRLAAPWDAPTLAFFASSYVKDITIKDFSLLAKEPAIARLKTEACDTALDHATVWEHAVRALTPILGRRPTAGEIVYACHGETGIRGEAESGYPHIAPACQVMRTWLKIESFNTSLLNTLLFLMQTVRDTTILRRGGFSALSLVMNGAREALDYGGAGTAKGRQAVRHLAECCLEQRLSPGGSADLLCLVLFVILGENEARAR